MNKHIRLVAIVALFALVAGGVFSFVGAQDATAEPTAMPAGAVPAGSVNCDSDLILNLYIAESYFGFDQVRNQLMGTTAMPMIDLTTINRGQFAPWFDANMAMATGSSLSDTQVTGLSGMLSMDDATLQSTFSNGAPAGTTTTSPLIPLAVAGEATECAQLRTELNRFFQVVAYQNSTGALPLGSGVSSSTNPELLTTQSAAATATPAS